MKSKTLVHSAGALLVIVAVVGCTKQNTTPGKETTTGKAEPTQTSSETTNVTKAMPDVVSAAKTKVEGMIAQAKSFIADQKYPEALDALNRLSRMTLAPAQQNTVDDLKTRLKTLMAGASSVANPTNGLPGN